MRAAVITITLALLFASAASARLTKNEPKLWSLISNSGNGYAFTAKGQRLLRRLKKGTRSGKKEVLAFVVLRARMTSKAQVAADKRAKPIVAFLKRALEARGIPARISSTTTARGSDLLAWEFDDPLPRKVDRKNPIKKRPLEPQKKPSEQHRSNPPRPNSGLDVVGLVGKRFNASMLQPLNKRFGAPQRERKNGATLYSFRGGTAKKRLVVVTVRNGHVTVVTIANNLAARYAGLWPPPHVGKAQTTAELIRKLGPPDKRLASANKGRHSWRVGNVILSVNAQKRHLAAVSYMRR